MKNLYINNNNNYNNNNNNNNYNNNSNNNSNNINNNITNSNINKNNTDTNTNINKKTDPKEKVIEYDVNGNEICFLFRKFGKCRFGSKCKKSHNLNGPVGEHNSNNQQQVQKEINKNNTCYKIKEIFNSCEEECKKTIIPLERVMILNGMKINNKNKKLIFPPPPSNNNNSHNSNNNQNNKPIDKIEIKRIKKNHFNLYKVIKDNLSKFPFIYQKQIKTKQQLNSINFSRFRPFLFLLLKSVLKLDFQNKWLITVGNSLISLIKEQPIINKNKRIFNNPSKENNSNIPYPVILERKLVEWGVNEINSRKIMVLVWKNLLMSLGTKTKISPLIIKCEKEVRNNDTDSLDYANSCVANVNFTKFSNSNLILQKQKQQQQPVQPAQPQTNQSKENWKEIKRRELEEIQLSLFNQ
ncbi:expressed protein [Dictyostelium purpureum]|uniref:Expressed protein n=1 Tax=Dictyostelium purpureum TaxID=5786 RepID=F1A5L3_DICPU|nr:uncharacterized protein DICPUDRAFT_100110 [Dictyostelium purpureum]EGC28513.1 expressed protein [Dictyostelium purpureum]|eukprot:XP_003294957.1 expressed protein [Dictyostelium purpureum]